MIRIPATLISFAIIILCTTSRISAFPVFIWFSAVYMIVLAIFYIVCARRKNTALFHKYIGWTWSIIPICFTMYMLFDRQTNWNRLWLFIVGACVGLLYVIICEKCRNHEIYILLRTIMCLLIAGMLSFCVMGINESVIRHLEYDAMELLEKDMYSSTQALFERNSYYLHFDYQTVDLSIDELQVSESYYLTLQEGDMVPICICTGLLGKKFYSLYEDSDDEFDFYGLNTWMKEQVLQH